jgi:anaerobic magnesium-protoporphyrin IX monomethyl ester cyclase
MSERRSVVLIYPRSVACIHARPRCDLPLELLCVGTPLSQAGYQVRIIDQRVSPDWRDTLLGELAKKPVCVGVTSMTGPQLRYALEASRLVKEHSDAPVVWGGIHASLLPEQTLAEPEIDFIVQGEGEETFLDLVRALEQNRPVAGIPGVWSREGGRANSTSQRPFIDVNEQPPLAYDLVDVSKYTRTVFGVKRLSFSSSRGCSFNCTYCYNTAYQKRQWRPLRPDIVISRIRDLVGRYPVRGLYLTDANFFLDMERARQILRGVVRENLGIVFSHLHILSDTFMKMSEQDIELIQQAGCKCLAVGIESGSERIQALLRKPLDLSRLLEVNRKLSRFSIMPVYIFMMGFPTETIEDLKQTVTLFSRLLRENPRATKTLGIYTPYPGTELFDLAVSEGLKRPQRLEDWTAFGAPGLGTTGAWLPEQTWKAIEMLEFCSFFVGRSNHLSPIGKANPLIGMLANLYTPVARERVKRLFYRFPLEIELAKHLRLYAPRH